MQDKEHKSFREFLAGENLTENLIHFVIHSIAMVPPTAGIRHGVMQTVKFLSSLGKAVGTIRSAASPTLSCVVFVPY